MKIVFVSISLLVLLSYVIYVVVKVGITNLPSLSDSYYSIEKGYLFQLALVLTVTPLIPIVLEITPEPFKFLAFATTAPILFVATAPRFKDMELEHRVHCGAAIISAVFSVFWAILMLKWTFLIVCPAIALVFFILYKKYGQFTFFAEMICFTLVYVTLFCILL